MGYPIAYRTPQAKERQGFQTAFLAPAVAAKLALVDQPTKLTGKGFTPPKRPTNVFGRLSVTTPRSQVSRTIARRLLLRTAISTGLIGAGVALTALAVSYYFAPEEGGEYYPETVGSWRLTSECVYSKYGHHPIITSRSVYDKSCIDRQAITKHLDGFTTTKGFWYRYPFFGSVRHASRAMYRRPAVIDEPEPQLETRPGREGGFIHIFPRRVPDLVPELIPPLQPKPEPAPLPYKLIPDRPTTPWSRTSFGNGNIRRPRNPGPTRWKPGPRQKETRKAYANTATIRAIKYAVSFVTEVKDLIDAAYKALPGKIRAQNYDKAQTLQGRVDLLYQYAHLMNPKQFFNNVVNNAIEDAILGKIGTKLAEVNAQAFSDRPVGLQAGNLDTPPQSEEFEKQEGIDWFSLIAKYGK